MHEISDFEGFVEDLVDIKGYGMNPCGSHCPDHGTEHAHLKDPDGDDMIVWPDGRVSDFDLTQPARVLVPKFPVTRPAR